MWCVDAVVQASHDLAVIQRLQVWLHVASSYIILGMLCLCLVPVMAYGAIDMWFNLNDFSCLVRFWTPHNLDMILLVTVFLLFKQLLKWMNYMPLGDNIYCIVSVLTLLVEWLEGHPICKKSHLQSPKEACGGSDLTWSNVWKIGRMCKTRR